MDNLILIRVAAALDRQLRGAHFDRIRDDGRHRIRMRLEAADGPRTLVLSLHPEAPWIGRPVARQRGRRPDRAPAEPFTAWLDRTLHGTRIERVEKERGDRRLTWHLGDGSRLVLELATHGANAVLLDAAGLNVAAAKKPRRAKERLAPGEPYRPAPVPAGREHADALAADRIDQLLARAAGQGLEPEEALSRGFFGIGAAVARTVVSEARHSGGGIGATLRTRLEQLDRGEVEPVVVASESPWEAADQGRWVEVAARLLPWSPGGESIANWVGSEDDPLATVGRFHEAAEADRRLEGRRRGLRTILDRQIERLHQASIRSAEDLRAFDDPDTYRKRGEALLAGLRQARRSGESVWVADPYDPEGRLLAIPDRPGLSLQDLAADQFRLHRRARRGVEAVARRRESLESRRATLSELRDRFAELRDAGSIETLGEAMRAEGIPVGLRRETRAGRESERAGRPRLEGVRLYTTRDGWSLLVGKSSRDNHRLTFRLASPEDYWFHAQGCPGAHVVLRNDDRRSGAPPRPSLEEAAKAAAWFSEARRQPAVDVQWTRRKYVRKPRGGAAGTVILKRFQTIRVVPADPAPDLA